MNKAGVYPLLADLPEIADFLSAGLYGLKHDPDPYHCEVIANQLAWARYHVLWLGRALRQDHVEGE